jgi:thioesterase domain-containing protein
LSIARFLAELQSRDIQVWADGDHLRCNAPAGVLTAELREQIRERKPDIMVFLRSAEALARQEGAIVPLQPHGTRVPIFGVAGHNGDVFCYRALAQHLGNEQPFFGLQPPGLDGTSEPLTSIEELAAFFARQVRAFRPGGPYVIAGYCAGGSIAYELAQQLQQQGAAIGFVALFASPIATAYRPLPTLQYQIEYQLDRVGKRVRALASPAYRERRKVMTAGLNRLQARRDPGEPPARDPVQVLRARLERATLVGLRRYTPRPFAGRLRLFLPSRAFQRSDNALRRWRTLARDTEEFCGPDDCEGDFMLLEPNVGAFAELFRRTRDQSPDAPPASGASAR